MKKIIITAVVILLLALAGYFIWQKFFNLPETTTNPPQPAVTGSLPTPQPAASSTEPTTPKPSQSGSSAGGVKAISQNPAFDFWLNPITGGYYITDAGAIYHIATTGDEEKIYDGSIAGLRYVIPSSDGDFALVGFGFPTKPTFSIFDVVKKTWTPLPDGAFFAAWHPGSHAEVAYLSEKNNQQSLNIFTLSTKKSRLVSAIDLIDQELNWAKPKELLLSDHPTNQTPGSLWSFNLDTKILRQIITDRYGLDLAFAPNFSYGLAFTNSPIPNSSGLRIFDASGQSISTPPFTTLPEKCALAETKTICAAPSDAGQLASFPDGYLQHETYTIDRLVSVAFASSGIQFAQLSSASQLGSIDADKLKISADGSALYLINRYDGRVYSLKLN